jgi:hypothetical protein
MDLMIVAGVLTAVAVVAIQTIVAVWISRDAKDRGLNNVGGWTVLGVIPIVGLMVYLIARGGGSQGVRPYQPSYPQPVTTIKDNQMQKEPTPPSPTPQATTETIKMNINKREVSAFAWLVIMDGPMAGRRLDLKRDETMIGRDGSICQILIENDGNVSRKHAKVMFSNGRFTIWDQASKNGTFVNGQRARQGQALFDGNEISIGETKLQFKEAKSQGSSQNSALTSQGNV